MTDKQNTVFLLGGQDLEMVTIKEVLLKEGFIEGKNLFDKQLLWNEAKLSAYKKVLKEHKHKVFYAVELDIDDETLANKYTLKIIDHHGDTYAHKEASLLQVLALLGKTATREQKLIAANDAEYIYGMKKLCASQKTINEIRKRDRHAQRITPEDEELAALSIQKATDAFIYAKTPKFSVISDSVFGKWDAYVIYNETKAVFYGYEVKTVLRFLTSQQIETGQYYYGGAKYGYVGLNEGILSKSKLKELIVTFQKQIKGDEIYSYHTFMLPFVFDGTFNKKENWKYEKFTVSTPRDYNEKNYFYKHVQDALFNVEEEDGNEVFISKYYEYFLQEGTYDISCIKGEYSLKLDGISLRVFNTGIAVLSFNLFNTTYADKEDIVAINDFGRRIYPQFLDEKTFTQGTKKVLLAECLTLNLKGETPICENFSSYDSIETLQKDQITLPHFILQLINKNFSEVSSIRPIIDDRMFVISSYHNDVLANEYAVYCEEKENYAYAEDEWWYKYLFIDGNGKTCQSRHMTKKLIAESTYDRWVEWGTLYGISRYSFVVLTDTGFGRSVVLPHMQTLYFQMFTLLLAYRASIIKFSDEIQNVTREEKRDISRKTQELYKKYLDFLNKLYFKEVTAQDQGIELYAQAMSVMNLEKYVADLDKEINELHSYAQMLQSEKENRKLNILNKAAGLLLPATVLSGLAGMNILPKTWVSTMSQDPEYIGGFMIVTIIFTWIVYGIINKKEKR